jgi:hypothetical protein
MVTRLDARRVAVAALMLGLSACGSSDDDPKGDNQCDPLVPEYCAFPFPNDFFTREDSSTPTGLRVDLKEGILLTTNPAPFNLADGWSVGATILFQLPGGTDAGFATPDDEGMALSLTAESKTVLLDAETGERVPHFAEEDKNSNHIGTRALTIRPVVTLANARRYIVAVRGVVDASGNVIEPTEGFAALRDGTASSDPAISSRASKYDGIFAALESAGVARDGLQLAWDFTTASVDNTTGWLLHMRDEALQLVRDAGHPYTITEVRAADCEPFAGASFEYTELEASWAEHVRYHVRGTFQVPNFMTEQAPGGSLLLGDDGLPHVNADAPWHDQPFFMVIPNSAGTEDPKPMIQYGHGLFGGGGEVETGHLRSFFDEYGYVAFSTSLDGMASPDGVWAGGTLATSPNVGRLAPMFDRLHQGMMQQIVLMDTMIEGFSADPTFGAYLDTTERNYHGISQGGIMGAVYAAISPHVKRAALGVMGQPYSLLLFRSKDFTPFFIAMQAQITDPRGWQLGIGLAQMLWDRVEPSGYSHHLAAGNRLPGASIENVLMRSAPGDHQVSQLGAHVMARAMNAKALNTGVRPDGIFGIEFTGAATATENFLVEYDFGNPIDPPCNLPPTYMGEGICKDPHEFVRRLEAARMQLDHYLQTGLGENFCPEGEAIDENGECIYPTAQSTFSADCGVTEDGLAEDDDLARRVCGIL